ncbi:hypothetical protein LTR16_004218, partial [Cryomyces antarcticus]
MLPSSLFSRTSTLSLLFLVPSILAQSIPGATFYGGGGSGTNYSLVDNYTPSNFFSKFNFYSSYDPTYGHVQYVDYNTAASNGYISSSANSVRLMVDTTNKYPRGGKGRPSVRIISDNTYTHGLFLLDLNHMPFGCGTWPAFWLLGPNWPSNGEIDIIEGVNTNTANLMSLHSSPNCTIAGSGQSGTLEQSNCDTSQNGNSGCGTKADTTAVPNNYGAGLNSIGGGVYATEWTSNYIKFWFFPRTAIPASITAGTPNLTEFGLPMANAQGSCNLDSHFANHSIIINTDFCGAYAGNTYGSDTDCPQNATAGSSLNSCVDFVGNNPQNFTQAYWSINSIKVFQIAAAAVLSASMSSSISSVVPVASSASVSD